MMVSLRGRKKELNDQIKEFNQEIEDFKATLDEKTKARLERRKSDEDEEIDPQIVEWSAERKEHLEKLEKLNDNQDKFALKISNNKKMLKILKTDLQKEVYAKEQLKGDKELMKTRTEKLL
jgi:chromosome segregation ATPase